MWDMGGGGEGHQVSLAGTQIKELPSTKVPVLKVLWYLGSGENVRLEAEQKESSLQKLREESVSLFLLSNTGLLLKKCLGG